MLRGSPGPLSGSTGTTATASRTMTDDTRASEPEAVIDASIVMVSSLPSALAAMPIVALPL